MRPAVMPHLNTHHQAILFMLAAYASIAVMGAFVKLASPTVPPSEILFFRFFIGLLFLLPTVYKDANFSFTVIQPGYFALRNIAGLASMILMFYSLKHLPLSTSVLLTNTASLFAPLFTYLLYRQTTSLPAIACTVIGFAGVCFMLYSTPEEFPKMYLLTGLASAALAALAYIGIKQLSKQNSALKIVFFFHLISSVVLPLFFASEWIVPSQHELLLMIMVGIFGLIFQVCVTKAFVRADIAAITPYIFTGVIFSGFIDWLLWNTAPSANFWYGAIVIVAAISILTKISRS